MSTPTASLPVSNSKTTENNDINDPVVQDVLKDFREEALPRPPDSSMIPDYEEDTMEFPPADTYPVHHRPRQYNIHDSYNRDIPNKQDKSIFNVDMELVKKNLIIVIIVLLIHNTGLMNMIYEKLPENIIDLANTNDILIKTLVLFVVLYLLMFLNYI
jgi:hypothetical protein